MRYSGFFAINLPIKAVGAVLLAFSTVFILPSFATASPLQPDTQDEIRKLVKQASKLTRKRLHDEAEVILRRAVEMDSRRSEARVELAFVLTKQRRLQEAYELVFAVAEAEPKNGRAFAVLGATLLASGRFPEARRMFLNAISLNRREHLAWAGYGMLDFYENRIYDSFQTLNQATFLEPNEPDYVYALAQVAARAERYGDAAEAYKHFLAVANITDVERRERIKGLISFLRFLGRTTDLYSTSGKRQTKVPFDLVGNRPIIKLKINGRAEPLRFVLDTGSGISVLSEETARRLKIRPITRGGYARGIGGDGKFEIVYGFLREVKIGDVEINSVPVYIRKFHHDRQPVDGYIGLGLISKFLATIDYGDRTFSLTRKDSDTREFRENSNFSLPLRLTSSGFLSGEVQLEGMPRPLNFIVDTGASVSVISDRVANSDGISRFANEEKLRVIGSAGVTDGVPTFLLPRVTFGTHSRQSIMAVALDLDLINEASGFEQSGILGGNFLKNYRLTFDFKNSKVTFVSINTEKD